MSDIKKVSDFLTDAGVFFLASVDGDQAKCRPLGFQMLVDDKIYFGVGSFKEVWKQIEANPKIEIVALNDTKDKFIRYYGTAKADPNPELVEKAFEIMPEIGKVYEENGWEMAIFYLDDATAEFRNMMAVEETLKFKY
ncbi:MAG: pyridoxamine 5'-phosphate oxidase family protein [Methanobrevibacter sp.]|uniref:pyridoxamine 5'-phosphate oxidase family protein n=1 Tax=Methanobrevibacter sp. TaxID=66852 RepID=UPI0025EFCF97|nr:pyridoxamine 5'-phosphate oxidase family protein [Methanobrevibacter sp.]MBR0271998.1 pyridoxamine 5'-phosphate oxidase family protein [Methanobrevibacter sp.]